MPGYFDGALCGVPTPLFEMFSVVLVYLAALVTLYRLRQLIDAKTEIYKISAWINTQLARLMPGGFSRHLWGVSPPLFKLFSMVLVYLAASVKCHCIRHLVDANTEK